MIGTSLKSAEAARALHALVTQAGIEVREFPADGWPQGMLAHVRGVPVLAVPEGQDPMLRLQVTRMLLDSLTTEEQQQPALQLAADFRPARFRSARTRACAHLSLVVSAKEGGR